MFRGWNASRSLSVFVATLSLLFAGACAYSQGTWATKAPISSPRMMWAAVELNGLLYAVGGWTGCSPQGTLQAYNPITNTWAPKAPMITPRGYLAAAALNGKIYAVAGSINCGVDIASVEAYDPATNTWSSKAPLPVALNSHGAAAVNGILYVIGSKGTSPHSVFAYNPATNSWSTRAPMPTPRSGHAVAVLNGKIYAMGGQMVYNGFASTDIVEAYDPVSDTWATKAPMSTERIWTPAAGTIGGRIYVTGGVGNGSYLSSAEAYNPATDTWSPVAPMPTARTTVASGVIGGSLYVIGGSGPAGNLATVEAFKPPAVARWVVLDLHNAASGIESFAHDVYGRQQVGAAVGPGARASLWTGGAASWVNLNPAGAAFSAAYGTDGAYQAGFANIGGISRAGLWSGTASSWVDLNPAGASESQARGARAGQQVGYARFPGSLHASLWQGSSASWVDLHPAGASNSLAHGTDGIQQVGYASLGGTPHASVWSGTAASWVNLFPGGYGEAYGVHAGQQVGFASMGSARASLWAGSAASRIDLHPERATYSVAHGVNSGQQVGTVEIGGAYHASMWSGTADSWLDLHRLLPPAFSSSEARAIWHEGPFTFVAGFGFSPGRRPLMWVSKADHCQPGSLVSWGRNDTNEISGTPAGDDFVAVSAGGGHSVALREDGSIVSWGQEIHGVIGDTPTSGDFVAVAAGNDHSVGLRTDGSLVAWGLDVLGAVSGVPSGNDFVAVSAGGAHSLALRADGSIVAWGYNSFGQVSNTPTGNGFIAIAAGSEHNLALRADGTLVSWGWNEFGQVTNTPTGNGFIAIGCGMANHSFAVRADGSIATWGYNARGQVSNTPTGTGFSVAAAGSLHSVALRSDGTLLSWGGNDFGPVVPAPPGNAYVAVSAGYGHSVAISTVPVNRAPVANNDAYATNEDSALNVAAPGVLANDTDPEANPLTAQLVAGPTHGTVSLNANGSFTYTPGPDYNGPDSFTYQARDGTLTSNTATVSIAVTAVNDNPHFSSQGNQTVLEDCGLQTVAGWATNINSGPPDESGQTLTFTTTNGNSALFSVQPAVALDGTLTFTPAANANGVAEVTVRLTDSEGAWDEETFTITVTAVNDVPSYTKGSNQSVLEDAAPQSVSAWATAISAGPANESGQVLDFIVTNDNSALFSGQPAIGANGMLTFTPAPDANGSATVTVRLHDNGGTANGGVDTSAPQTFTITVTPVNDAPSFTSGGNVTVLEDSGNHSAPWASAIVAGPSNESTQTLNFTIDGNSNPGLFSVSPSISPSGVLNFTPALNAYGSATITVRLHDSGGTANGGQDVSPQVIFTIAVTPVNDPPIASNDNYMTLEDTPLSIGLPGVLSNDSDIEGDTLSAVVVTPPLHGALTLYPDGSFLYTPDPNYNGTDSFTYQASDGVALSNVATVMITVSAVNDPPDAANDTDDTYLNTPKTIVVLYNDADIDGDPLTVTAVTQPADGTAAINAGGTVTYTPRNGFTGTDTFTYTISDGAGGTDTATVTIFVSRPNRPPRARNDDVDTNPDTPVTLDPLVNDDDLDGDPITLDSISQPSNGSAVINGDGTVTYTPAAGFIGNDTFTYTISDGRGGTDVGRIRVRVR